MNARQRPQPVSPTGRDHLDDLLDEALEQSFPASDPIAVDFRVLRNKAVVEEDEK